MLFITLDDMDKFTIQGTRRLLSLTRTKIRLAEESGTIYTKPKPLPLVKLISGRDIETVEKGKEYREELAENIDYENPRNISNSVLQLIDIIEGVKYDFEPAEFQCLIDDKIMKKFEDGAKKNSSKINLLLMTKTAPEGINLFVGENPLENSIHLGRVPSTIADFLRFAFSSDYFSENLKLKNINSIIGHRTLILNAIWFSLGEFGVELKTESDLLQYSHI